MILPSGSGARFRREHGLTGAYIVSFAGVLGHLQDLDVVLDAAALTKATKEIVWLIVGDGVQKDGLENKARDLGLENVRFVPMVPREVYPEVLYASDVCLATLKAEVKTPVIPSKMLGIMAAGKPLVACMDPKGDGPALVREADCGYALPAEDPEALANTVRTLFADRELGKRLGANGRAYAEAELSLDAAAQQHAKLFEQIA